MIGDYEFGKHPEDIELLDQISHVAAAAHAPFVSAAAPDLVNVQSWSSLPGCACAIWRRYSTPPSSAKWKIVPSRRGFALRRSLSPENSWAASLR